MNSPLRRRSLSLAEPPRQAATYQQSQPCMPISQETGSGNRSQESSRDRIELVHRPAAMRHHAIPSGCAMTAAVHEVLHLLLLLIIDPAV